MLHARATCCDRIDLTNGAKTHFQFRTEFSVSTGMVSSMRMGNQLAPGTEAQMNTHGAAGRIGSGLIEERDTVSDHRRLSRRRFPRS